MLQQIHLHGLRCYANVAREKAEGLKEPRCPYCRESLLKTEEEADQNYMKRAKANDPVALRQLGGIRSEEGDYEGAFQYFTNAAGLERKSIIWKRLLLVDMLEQGTILLVQRGTLEGMIEQ